jgi:hypothetical protein
MRGHNRLQGNVSLKSTILYLNALHTPFLEQLDVRWGFLGFPTQTMWHLSFSILAFYEGFAPQIRV